MLYSSFPWLFFFLIILRVKIKVAQSCMTLCHPVDYTFHGILQARILERVTFPFSRDLPNPVIKPKSPALQTDSLPAEPQGKPRIMEWVAYPLTSGSSLTRSRTLSSALQVDALPAELSGKEPSCNAGDLGSIPGLGRSPGEGNNYLLQYSGLENSVNHSNGSQRVRHDWVTFTL